MWLLVLRGSYQSVERIFLVACLVYLAYPISGFLAHPHWLMIAKQSVTPHFQTDIPFVATVVGVVGTTIAPWMQFYLQATVVERGTRPAQYHLARWDVIVGSIFAIVVVFFILVACAASVYPLASATGDHRRLRRRSRWPRWPGQAATILFAIGLLNAALFAASILPLSTAYTVCEGIGWERGLDRKFHQAPHFYSLYALLIILGAGIVLMPHVPLIRVMIFSQVLNGLLLPVILIVMLKLVTREDIMGKFRGRPHLCHHLLGVDGVADRAGCVLARGESVRRSVTRPGVTRLGLSETRSRSIPSVGLRYQTCHSQLSLYLKRDLINAVLKRDVPDSVEI